MSENNKDLKRKEEKENEMCFVSKNIKEHQSSFQEKNNKRGLPDFFIDTILDQIPSATASTSVSSSTEPKDAQNSTTCKIEKKFGNIDGQSNRVYVNSNNPRFNLNYFDARRGFKNQFFQNFPGEPFSQASIPYTFPSVAESTFETCRKFATENINERSFNIQSFTQRMMLHQYIQSSMNSFNPTSVSNCHFNTYLNTCQHLQENSGGHFKNFQNASFSCDEKDLKCGRDEAVLPRKKQLGNQQIISFEKRTKMSATAQNDILSKLNCLFENKKKSEDEIKESKRKPALRAGSNKSQVKCIQSEDRNVSTSSNEQSSSSVSASCINEGSSSVVGSKIWPSWVYCTRFSDRPSAGPRVRRTRKKTKALKEGKETDKRPRTAFSKEQLDHLQREFETRQYLTEEGRVSLSNDLGLSVAQIKVWFQNKRAKVKKSKGIKSRLACLLEAQGLYNHRTQPVKVKDY